MRESFSLPLIMLLSVLGITVVLVCGFVIVNWGLYIYPESITDIGVLVALAVEGVQEILPPVALLGLSLSILRYKRKPGIRALSLFLILTVSAASFISSTAYLPRLMKKQPVYVLPPTVDEGFIHPMNGDSVFVGAQTGNTLERVLVLKTGERPAFEYSKELTLTNPQPGAGSGFFVSPGAGIFTPPRFLADMFRDILQLNENLRTSEAVSFTVFILNCLGIVFCVFSGCLLITIPRWPLYNGLLVLFGCRLFLYAVPFLWKPGFQQIAGLVVREPYLRYSPAAVLLASGLVFLICTGLFAMGRKKEPERTHV